MSETGRARFTRVPRPTLVLVGAGFSFALARTLSSMPRACGRAFDGSNVWVTNSGDNTLTQIRVSDGALLATFATGLDPAAVLFDGAQIWVANKGSNTVSRF